MVAGADPRRLLDYGSTRSGTTTTNLRCGTTRRRRTGLKADPMSMARPLQTLLMGRCSFEALVQRRPDERPFVLSRAGSPGIQRYAQTWTGDNATSWETLRWNIPMGLGLSLSGLGNMGHDVGGFAGPKPDPELFVRWVQNGIFHPRFTIHSYNDDGTANEPWMHPEALPLVREALRFRYRLIPYLYSLAVEDGAHRPPMPARWSITSPTTHAAGPSRSTSCSALACWSRRCWSRAQLARRVFARRRRVV